MATDVRSPIDLAEERNLHRETSTVYLWRGYVTAAFYARSVEGEVIAESQAFRWRKPSAPPNAGATRAAYDALAAALEDLGWRSTEGDGDAWYEVTFERYVLRPKHVLSADVEPTLQPAVLTPPPPVAIARPAKAGRSTAGALPESEPAPRPQVESRRSRVKRRSTVVVGLTLLTSIVAAGALLSLNAKPGQASRHLKPARTIATSPPSAPSPSTGRTVVTQAGRLVRLRVSGVSRGSWVEVRRGSSTGALLYNNVLVGGKSVLFKGPRLWAQFGAAGNLAILVDGKRVPFNGTIEHTFLPNSR